MYLSSCLFSKFGLVYSLLPVFLCVCLALSYPALSTLKTVNLGLILVCVFLVPPRCVHRDTLMVWGCISAYGMGSLHVLEGTMNAEKYIKVLEQHMLPSRRRAFQQDNAKPHTAAITTAWLRSRRVHLAHH